MIRAILFDFDGTLAINRSDTQETGLRWLRRLNAPATHHRALLESYPRFERLPGPITLASALEGTYRHCHLIPPSDLTEIATELIAEYTAQMRLLPHTLDMLRDFADFPKAIVTNGPSDVQRAAIKAVDLEEFFQSIVVSGDADVGVRKPSSRPFLIACERLGVAPAESLMIGNSLPKDIEGARAAGLHALYIPS